MRALHRLAGLVTLVLTLIAAGCGGRNNDDNPPPTPPPPPPPPAPVTPGDTFALTSGNRLITFNRASPALQTAVSVSGLASGENILGIDIRPGGNPTGELYALGSSGGVYTINSTSGAATQKAMLAADAADTTSPFAALDGAAFGVDFNPVPDRLRIVSDTGQNLRVNADTGATITDGPLNSNGVTRAGVTAAAYLNSFASACRTTLYYIDTATDGCSRQPILTTASSPRSAH